MNGEMGRAPDSPGSTEVKMTEDVKYLILLLS